MSIKQQKFITIFKVPMILYLSIVFAFCAGIYFTISSISYLNRVFGIFTLQTSIILFYITYAKISGGDVPIISKNIQLYSNPIPQVLMLTAIVVGFSIFVLLLVLLKAIYKNFCTLDSQKLQNLKQGNNSIMQNDQ